MSTWWTAAKDLALICGLAVWLAGFLMCLIGWSLDRRRPRRLTAGQWLLVIIWQLAYPVIYPIHAIRDGTDRRRSRPWEDIRKAFLASRPGPPACEQHEPELETVEEKE